MYSYFSNKRYCPNYNVAKCIQYENTVRKEIMKYEIKPLKNSEAAKGIIENIINPNIEKVNKLHKYNYGIINPWVLFMTVSFVHLLRIRNNKKNLSEMYLPFWHLGFSLFCGFLFCYPISLHTNGNLRSKLEIIIARTIIKNMDEKMNNIYLKKTE